MAESNPAAGQEKHGVDPGLARHGHLSYLEIPTLDPGQSAHFYEAVFGWSIEGRDHGQASFDDGSGSLIGRLVPGRIPSRESGFLPYIYVDRIDAAIERIVQQGGEIVAPPYPEGKLWVATFRDPAGNLLGIWQAGPR